MIGTRLILAYYICFNLVLSLIGNIFYMLYYWDITFKDIRTVARRRRGVVAAQTAQLVVIWILDAAGSIYRRAIIVGTALSSFY